MNRTAAASRCSLDLLPELLRRSGVSAELRGRGDVLLAGASSDSRKIQPGEIFLAWKGTVTDAHDYVASAVRNGAVAAVVEDYVDVAIPQLRVDDARRAAAVVAHWLEGDPSKELRVAAVTGTNGKTTCAFLIRHLMSATGPAATIGTLGLVGPDGVVRPGSESLTTPGPVEISRQLRALADEGVTSVSLEASSHALEQSRLDRVDLDVAVFTNLTLEHLDYHRTFADYREAKARILLLVGEDGGVVVNGADPAWSQLPPINARLIVTRIQDEPVVGRPRCRGRQLPDLIADDIALSGEGSRFMVRWGGEEVAVSLPLLGRFNVDNGLGALGAALMLEQELEAAAESLGKSPQPTGRLELTVRDPVPVILDYAHTPHALERVLETLRPLFPGRIILVFGAGGDRDRSKRPEMGRMAAEGADLSIVTSDNPRTEDPEAIVDEVVAGMTGAFYERITDRKAAIERALEVARSDDVVLLAGKGHETYQIVGTESRPFDERRVVREIIGSGRAA